LRSPTSCRANNTSILKVRTSFNHQYGDVGHEPLPSTGVTVPKVGKAAICVIATSAIARWRKKNVWLDEQNLRTILVEPWRQEDTTTVEGLQ
jgi:hypothetical protein